MNKSFAWRYGLGLITLPLLAALALGLFNLVEIVTAPKQAPIAATPAAIAAGAQIYVDNCAVCHGLPNQPDPHAAAGLWPDPPQFFRRFRRRGPAPSPADLARFAQRRAVGSYLTVRDGVPATGMPNFRHTLSDTQMWQVSLMIAAMQNLPPAAAAVVQAAISAGQPPSPSMSAPAAAPSPAAPTPGATR